MATNNIDTSIWITQQALASELGVTVQCIHNWIARKKIEAKKIAGSRLILVNRLTAPAINTRKSTSKSTV